MFGIEAVWVDVDDEDDEPVWPEDWLLCELGELEEVDAVSLELEEDELLELDEGVDG